MSLSIPALISVLFLPMFLGASLLRAIGFSFCDDKLAYFGWCYIAGCLSTGLVLFLWLTIGLPLQATLLVPTVLGLSVLLLILSRSTASQPTTTNRQSKAYVGAVVVLLLFVVHGIVASSSRAIVSTDEGLIWSMKAKLVFRAGSFGAAFQEGGRKLIRSDEFLALPRESVNDLLATIPSTGPVYQLAKGFATVLEHPPEHHLDYPMLNPLLQVWAFLHAGEILHWENRLLIQCALLACLLILASALSQLVRPCFAVPLLVLFVALPDTLALSRSCLSDPLVALGFLTAMDALFRWQKDKSSKWPRLLCLGLAFMLWSKNEAILYLLGSLLGLGLAILCARERRKLVFHPANLERRELAWLALPLLVLTFTLTVNAIFGFRNDIASPSSGGLSIFERLVSLAPERLGEILGFFWQRIVAGPVWGSHVMEMRSNYLYFAFLCLLVAFPLRAMRSTRAVLTTALLVAMTGSALVYIATPYDLGWHLNSSAPRVTWQAIPCVILWVASMATEILPSISLDSQ